MDYTGTSMVERELLLAKVSLLGPDHFQEHFERSEKVAESTNAKAKSDGEGVMNANAALQLRASQLAAINQLTTLFHGRVADISTETIILELTATPDRVDNFLSLLRPYGVLEACRTGTSAMTRAPHSNEVTEEAEDDVEVEEVFLPPG